MAISGFIIGFLFLLNLIHSIRLIPILMHLVGLYIKYEYELWDKIGRSVFFIVNFKGL